MPDTPNPPGSPVATIHHVMTEIQRANGRLERLDMAMEKMKEAIDQIKSDISAIRAQGEQ